MLGPAHLLDWINNWAASPWSGKQNKAMLTYGGGLKGNFTRVKKLSSLMRMGVWLGFDELGEKERENI